MTKKAWTKRTMKVNCIPTEEFERYLIDVINVHLYVKSYKEGGSNYQYNTLVKELYELVKSNPFIRRGYHDNMRYKCEIFNEYEQYLIFITHKLLVEYKKSLFYSRFDTELTDENKFLYELMNDAQIGFIYYMSFNVVMSNKITLRKKLRKCLKSYPYRILTTMNSRQIIDTAKEGI